MTTWIDLTDFLKWSGGLTGIQRLQYNISKEYIQSGKEVRFFVYDDVRRCFREVDFKPKEIVKNGIVAGGDNNNDWTLHELVMKIRRKITKKILANRDNVEPLTTGDTIKSPFRKDDAVLVLGGIWAGNFIDDLEANKHQQGFKVVHFIHDMIPTLFPGYVVDWLPGTFTRYQEKAFAISEGIIANSQSTANDITSFIEDRNITSNSRIVVARIGDSLDVNSSKKDYSYRIGPLPSEGFMLSVSTIEGRKNHTSLFYVMKEAKRRNIAIPKIVIAGRNGWLTDDIRYIINNDLDAKRNIVVLNDVDDDELAWLYQNCRFTIFPSFYEGWGMPIAESLAYGKLCLSSDTSSMPEVGGDLVDYFSPYDTGSILDCIVKYMDEKELANKEEVISSSYHQTTWEETFKVISTTVDSVVNDAK